jgi:hypothetical protein
MAGTLGAPDNTRTQTRLKLGSEDIYTIHVYGAQVARLGLRHVLDDVKTAGRTELIENLQTDGMYNLRKIRGRDVWSNHAWGFAVDLNYGPGEELGDGLVQAGLLELYPFFHKRGWYWGGGYHGREDGMHFEPSVSLIQTWISSGLL